VRARALADKAALDSSVGATDSKDHAEQALAIARDLDDPARLARALTACGSLAVYNAEVAGPFLTEAIDIARTLGDGWRLSQALGWQAYAAITAGDPIAARAAAEEGRDLAEAIGDRFCSAHCRWCLGVAQMMNGELAGAVAQSRELVAEAEAAHNVLWWVSSQIIQGQALAWQGETSAARAAANLAIELAAELGWIHEAYAYGTLARAAIAAGDVAAAKDASEANWEQVSLHPDHAAINANPMAEVALARGDLVAARGWADDVVSATSGWHLSLALTTRARVAAAQGEPEQAERDAHDALAVAADIEGYQALPDIFECLAGLAGDSDSHQEAARLFGAAQAMRQRMGVVRFQIYDAGYEASVAALRDAMGEADFESAWAEGAELSVDEAIAYAQRGRGEGKRPTSGWASLTPTERDVVRLVSEGFANKNIATRLFVSPRTVQTHLTHVYTKLGLNSRVQLAQEAARHP
jgi:DNA-binding CsgD family transcriptional regulator